MPSIGQAITFEVQFTNLSGSATDPTTTTFLLLEAVDGTERRWVYNAVPVEGTHYPTGTNPITRTSAGLFSLVYIPRVAERHAVEWRGVGNSVDQIFPLTAFVRHSALPTVEP